MEKAEIAKTADLFQNYQVGGVFSHSDAATEGHMNALGADFSGCFVFQAGINKSKRDQVAVIHKR